MDLIFARWLAMANISRKEGCFVFINEYGSRDDPTVILLAPMMISGSDLYEQMSPYFRGSYHIVSPDQGGHGKAGAYISADEEYRTLKSFLLETGCTTIKLVYGASMGVAVAYRLFLDPDFTVCHAWFDGVALSESAALAEWFVSRMFRKRKKLSAKLQGKPSSMLVNMYGETFAKRMAKNFERITPEDIDAICHACCHYDLRKLTEESEVFQENDPHVYAEGRAHDPPRLSALRLYGGTSEGVCGGDRTVYR